MNIEHLINYNTIEKMLLVERDKYAKILKINKKLFYIMIY